MKKKRLSCFLTVLTLVFTTGCWDSTELNDLAIELAWGIDKAKNKGVQISTQAIIPSKISGGQGLGGVSGGKGAGQGKPYFVVSDTGVDTLDAVQELQVRLSRKIFRGHRRVIVIGEPLARQGIKDLLDTYTRDPNLKLRTDIFVVKGSTAKEFLQVSYPLETIPGLGAMKEYNRIGSLKEMAFLNFLISASSEGSCPVMPALAIGLNSVAPDKEEQEDHSDGNGFHIAGGGIFNNDLKLVGFLDINEGKTMRWITGRLKEHVISAYIPEEKSYASLDLTKLGSSIQPIFQGNKVKFLVTLTGQGMIRENNTGLDLSQPHNVAIVQNALKKHVEDTALSTITNVQKEYRTDIFGFGDALHRKYPDQWKSKKDNWDKEFSEAEVSVKANLTIRRIGVTGPSLQLQESLIKK